MTPTATYIAEENCLQLLPQEEAPLMPDLMDYNSSDDYIDAKSRYSQEVVEYNAHLATLRKIPCDPSCKGLWKDGQKVVENVDYEVKDYPIPAMLPTDPKFIAFPLVPVSEDEFQESIDLMAIDSKIFVDKSMAIANRIGELLEKKGLKQKDLAAMMGKTEAEISRMLAGMQNLTLRMISKVEAVLGEEIISITH